MKRIIIYLFMIIVFCEAKSVPTYIKTCNRNDPNLDECFANNANLAMSHIAKGDKEYGIGTLLPLKWRELLVVDIPPIKLMLLDIYVYGTENMTIVDPAVDLESKSIDFTFTNPLIIWRSKYVAVIEENGISKEIDGHAEISIRQGKFRMINEYELNTIDGVEYANITKYNSDFLTVDIDFKLSNLDTNPIFYKEFEKAKKNFVNDQVQIACGKTVAEYMNKIFTVVPFKQIFTD